MKDSEYLSLCYFSVEIIFFSLTMSLVIFEIHLYKIKSIVYLGGKKGWKVDNVCDYDALSSLKPQLLPGLYRQQFILIQYV